MLSIVAYEKGNLSNCDLLPNRNVSHGLLIFNYLLIKVFYSTEHAYGKKSPYYAKINNAQRDGPIRNLAQDSTVLLMLH